MIHSLPVPELLDHRLTQAAMRKLVQFTNCQNERPDFALGGKNQVEGRHVTANLFSDRGLCDPGDLKPSLYTLLIFKTRLPGKLSFGLTT